MPVEDLIDYTFRVYDEDGDGFITKDELLDTIKNILKCTGEDINDPYVLEHIKKRVDKVMHIIDRNHDGKISEEEMLKAYKEDNALFELY